MEKQPTQKPRRASGRHLTLRARNDHLDRWERSGLSAKAYARKHGVSYKSLYAWRSQSRRAATKSSGIPDAPAFVPVRMSALPNIASQDSLKIILRTGALECVVSGAGSAAKLVAVVKSLKQEVFDV
jgi:hypothetical protein